MPPADIRDQVAAVLQDLNAADAPLGSNAADATWRRYVVEGTNPHAKRYLPGRLRVHQRILNDFMADGTEVLTDGLAAVVTAGPPAVGKSTRLDDLGLGNGWRRIDADDFKMRLIKDDLQQGQLKLPAGLIGMTLPDALPVMPLELSGLYHHESTALADKAREISLENHENIVIEGTLSYEGQVATICDDLVAHDYRKLRVVLVEVPVNQALEQALGRWWQGRKAGGLGGRFTSPDIIRGMYRADGTTSCRENARQLVDQANAVHLSAILDGDPTS